MRQIWTRAGVGMLIMVLMGCATSKQELLPHGDQTMLDVWVDHTGASNMSALGSRTLLAARKDLQRSIALGKETELTLIDEYTRDASREIYSLFRRLPNPDLVMFVFPHLAGTEQVPVPGYTTVFPFFERVQYAMPGERTTEDY